MNNWPEFERLLTELFGNLHESTGNMGITASIRG